MREFEHTIPDFLEEFIRNPLEFRRNAEGPPFSYEELEIITKLVKENMKEIPNLIILGDIFKDVLIVGDTHGFIESTVKIIQPFLDGRVQSLLFLGDYVDRGPDSLLNFVLVLALSFAWPERVVVLRGNHEALDINGMYGFKVELLQFFQPRDVYEKVTELIDIIYNYLSLAAITPQGSIAIHAGVPKGIDSIEGINMIPKPHFRLLTLADTSLQMKANSILEQVRWNDPREEQIQNFDISFRGGESRFFNEDALDNFLTNSQLKRIVRAHESSRGGYVNLFNGKLIHIFSTEPYFGKVPKAYILHEQLDGKTILRDLEFNPVEEI